MADPSLVLYNDKPYAFVSGGQRKDRRLSVLRMDLPAWRSLSAALEFQRRRLCKISAGLSLCNSWYRDRRWNTGRLLRHNYETNAHGTHLGDRRYDDLFTMDLNIQKVFDMGNAGRFTLAADLFNIFNADTIVQRNRSLISSTFNDIQENLSGAHSVWVFATASSFTIVFKKAIGRSPFFVLLKQRSQMCLSAAT